jgi:hypothetical protein
MYAAVPRITPALVTAVLNVGEFDGSGFADVFSNAFANPKREKNKILVGSRINDRAFSQTALRVREWFVL